MVVIRKITFNNETLTLREWAARTGLHTSVLRYRLDAGWSIADVLNPTKDARGRKSCLSEYKTARLQTDFNELVSDMNRSLATFQRRMQRLLMESQTPGVVEGFSESSNDRSIPIAQVLV